jgi:hypothetical protein
MAYCSSSVISGLHSGAATDNRSIQSEAGSREISLDVFEPPEKVADPRVAVCSPER